MHEYAEVAAKPACRRLLLHFSARATTEVGVVCMQDNVEVALLKKS